MNKLSDMKSNIVGRIKKSNFVNSFKHIGKKETHAFFLEILFYLIIASILMLSYYSLNVNFSALGDLEPTLNKMNSVAFDEPGLKEELEVASSTIFSSLVWGAVIILITILLLIGVSAFFRGLIWFKVLGIKYDKKKIIRFLNLKSIWTILWILLCVLVYFVFIQELSIYIIIGLIILYIHFTLILHSSFDGTRALFSQFGTAFRLGTVKIGRLMVPYLLSIVMLQIAVMPGYLTGLFMTSGNLVLIVYSILFIAYFNWSRRYISSTVFKISNNISKPSQVVSKKNKSKSKR